MGTREIKPFVKLELDCFQNLIASLIEDRGYCTAFLGSVWPWEFRMNLEQQNRNDKILLLDAEPANPGTLKSIYNVDMETVFTDDIEDAWIEIKEKLNMETPVIVSFDQFYAHYHYPYIYGKQHGDHAIMLLGYDDGTKLVRCMSSIPEYEGAMEYDTFFKGMQGVADFSYTILTFGDKSLIKNKYDVWSCFVQFIEKMKNSYLDQSPKNVNHDLIYSIEFKRLLEDFVLQSDNLSERLKTLSNGTWGWHIDRRCKWTINFIELFSEELTEEKVSSITGLLEENNREWVLVYRYLFKASQSLKMSDLNKIEKKLEGIIDREMRIFDEILTSNISSTN